MTTVSVERQRFNAGVWSPELQQRTDLERYPGACKQMVNFIPKPEGGAFNRGGFIYRYLYGTYASLDYQVALIPFEYSADQNYVIGVSATTNFVMKDKAELAGAVITGSFPYNQSELYEVTFTQDGNVMYFFHPNHAPRKLVRDSSDELVWTLTTPTFGPDAPKPTNITNSASTGGWFFLITSVNPVTGEESEETGAQYSFDVQSNVGEKIDWDGMFTADGTSCEYNVYVLQNGSTGPWGFVARVRKTSSYIVPTGFDPDALDVGFPYYKKDYFNAAGKYPAVGVFYQQRLVMAGTDNEPNTIWGSWIGLPLNFSRNESSNDSEGFKFAMNSKKVNAVRWMVPLDSLIIGTTGGEWVMSPGAQGGAVTASSVSLVQQSDYGSSRVQPELIGRSILFLDKARRVGRDMEFSYQSEGYQAVDMALYAKHLFKGKAVQSWAFQREPHSTLWVVIDNKLIALTYLKEQGVYAWHTHTSYNCDFLQVMTVADGNGLDDLYAVTRRYTADRSTSYIAVETLSEHLPSNSRYKETEDRIDLKDGVFLDSAASYDNPINVTAYTYASTDTRVTATGHGLVTGDENARFVDIAGVEQPSELNGRFRLKVVDANTLIIREYAELTTDIDSCTHIDSSAYDPYTSGGELRETTTVPDGFLHLAAWPEVVTVVADGIVYEDQTPAAGTGVITLPVHASRVHAGFKYTAIIEPLDFVYTSNTGSVKDRVREVNSAVVEVENTRCLQIGTDTTDLEDYTFPEAEVYGDPIPLYSGNLVVSIEAGTEERASRVYIQCDDPVSCAILGITGRVSAGDY